MLAAINFENPVTPLEKAMAAARSAMIRRSCRYHTIYETARIWRHLLAYAQEKGIQDLSAGLVDDFEQAFRAAKSGASRHTLQAVKRALRILVEHSARGTWDRFPTRREGNPDLPPPFEKDLLQYLDYWRNVRQVAARTSASGERYLRGFLLFLEQNGIVEWPQLNETVLHAFFAANDHFSPKSLERISGVIRIFFNYLFVEGILSRDWASVTPRYHGFRQVKLPAIWTDDEVQAMLAAVDRASPLGKRNYAILLLGCRLGMRAGDIRTLRLEQIKWEDARIEFLQGKTGVKQTLPLSQEIGEAIIDYLQNARPVSDHREVFLSLCAPYDPPGDDNKFYGIISKYRRLAGISKAPNVARGMHSLRHTLASDLRKEDVPLETIAGILGHVSLETTTIYARVDLAALRQAALDPEEVFHV